MPYLPTSALRQRSVRDKWRRSSALVITLAIITVLTVLLLAFLTRAGMERQISGASAAESQADLIAKAGLDVVVTDFRQEIAAGSTVTANTTANSTWPAIYLPISANVSVPARILPGTETNNFNLVRRSMTTGTFTASEPTYFSQYSGFPINNLASSPNANTTANVSANGRIITAARWNKAQLLNDTTHFVSPDWVLVTRNGPKAFTAWDSTVRDASPGNTNFIVGRYAYTVYNEGGLLDVNVVGRLTGIPTPPLGKTSAAAVADLTQLTNAAPNWTASACIPSQSAVDKLVQWRNATTSGTAYNSSNPGDTNSYFGYLTGSTNAFTQVLPGNQAFLTRQDLINSITSTASGSLGADGFTTNALPFLATFTRQLNAPSFYPLLTNFNTNTVSNATTADATSRPKVGVGTSGSIFTVSSTDISAAAHPAVGQDSAYNPPLADVRFPVAGTLPDGTTVTAGEPMLRKRFALSRLALLIQAINSSATNTQSDTDPIYRYFGLYRTDSTKPWVYNHGTTDGSIYTLPELQAAFAGGTAERDPDFFELLQATIAVGSLGRDAAEPIIGNGDETAYGPAGGGTGMTDTVAINKTAQSVTLHVLQIGANIIDSANSGYVPMVIQPGTAGAGIPQVYGVEDLPYISKIIQFMCVDSTAPPPYTAGAWYMFELWNPYQTRYNPAGYPTAFRIVPQSALGLASQAWANIKVGPSGNTQFYTSTDFTSTANANNVITFTPLSSTNFCNPAVLSPNCSPSFPANATFDATQTGTMNLPTITLSGQSYNFAGIYVGDINPGKDTRNNWLWTAGTTFAVGHMDPGTVTGIVSGVSGITSATTSPNYLNFQLQCQFGTGQPWITYDVWQNLIQSKPTSSPSLTVMNGNPEATGGGAATGCVMYDKLDPRTDRWSGGVDLDGDVTGAPGFTKINASWLWNPKTYANGFAPYVTAQWVNPLGTWYGNSVNSAGFSVKSGGHFYSLTQNNVNNTYYYADPDGVVRPGDDLYGNTTGDTSYLYGWTMNESTPNTSNGPFLSRPIMLHRPFQSVGELGYVFRDVPWKSLDFFSSRSGDSALLDVFSANEEPALVAGKIDANTRNVPALAALLNGSSIDELGSATLGSVGTSSALAPGEALSFANRMVAITSAGNAPTPLHNKSDLVNRILASEIDVTKANPNLTDTWGSCYVATGSVTQAQKARIKVNRETAVRALSEGTASRTWNFMIDIIAQSGRYTSTSGSFADFTVDGEKRYWLHVAIDRYTGKIVDEQLEPVYE
jgi:Tfp pilus assembly protein PilX